MTTVLKAADSADFLGLVPALAGFTPQQSIVLVPFESSRAHGAMRIDLPQDDVELEEFVDAAVGLVSRVRKTDAVALVVYTDEPPQHTRDGIVLPHTIVIEDLLAVAMDSGLRIVDALCVAASGWSSYLDDDPVLRSLDEIPEAPPIPGIADVSGDQNEGAGLPVTDLAAKERVARALHDLTEVMGHEHPSRSARENPQAINAALMLDDLPGFFETALEQPENLPPFAAAGLLWCMNRPTFRDAALMQWATDLATGIEVLDAQLRFAHQGITVPPEMGDIFVGQGPAPDPDRLRLALTVTRNVAASAPRPFRAAPLTMAAWLSWALGRSTHASHYLAAVSEIDPEYSLARLLNSLISAAVLPEWTFRRA